jgi:prophage regulatory protein
MLRQRAVLERVPAHPTTLWRWEQEGRFPRRVKLGPNSVAWFEDEVDAWQAARAESR